MERVLNITIDGNPESFPGFPEMVREGMRGVVRFYPNEMAGFKTKLVTSVQLLPYTHRTWLFTLKWKPE